MRAWFYIPLIWVLITGTGMRGSAQTVPCCTIIDINKDSGNVLIRNNVSGWIKSFKPDALEFAELKIGDSVDATLSINKVSRVRNQARTYRLMQPIVGEPCCRIIELKPSKGESIVVAETVAGDSLTFNIPDSIGYRFVPGKPLFVSATHGFAMLYTPLVADSSNMVYLGFPIGER